MSWAHEKGINLDIDIKKLIKHVHISPYADSLVQSIVRSILDKYGFNEIPVTKSNLYSLI